MILKIKNLRENAGMTQSELGAAMGVAQNCVSAWEIETRLPRTRQLPELARVLGVDIGELFEPDNNPYSVPEVFPDHEAYGIEI